MEIDHGAPALIRRETEAGAPIETVWAVHSDIDSWPAWHPDITEATLEGPLEAGARFRWKSGPGAITSTIVELEAPHRLVWTGRSMGIEAIHVWNLEPTDAGTRIVTEESLTGWPARLLKPFLQRTLDKTIDAWIAALRETAEGRTD